MIDICSRSLSCSLYNVCVQLEWEIVIVPIIAVILKMAPLRIDIYCGILQYMTKCEVCREYPYTGAIYNCACGQLICQECYTRVEIGPRDVPIAGRTRSAAASTSTTRFPHLEAQE
jgi:hypothetical protein